jgi:RsbT co-antagonist protein rsbRD N-terminal domain
MSERFAMMLREYEGVIIRAWVDEVYAERRAELPARLSYGQLVGHLPEFLEELARLLDNGGTDAEIIEATRRLRAHSQVRFYQGLLMDEVARELMLFRQVITDFLWREGFGVRQGSLSELRDALRRVNRFVDEMIAQLIVIYAASLRPPVETRTSVWPPPRRRKTDFPEHDER